MESSIKDKIEMEIGEIKELTISDFFEMCEQDKGEYQIETPDGWKDINFLVKKKNRECYNLMIEDGAELECSNSHQVLTVNGWVEVENLDVQNDIIITENGEKGIIANEYIGIHDTFDLQVDSNESRYYSNGIISHNCGKSLVCKAISKIWGKPLLKLDFGKLFGSLIGKSEENARLAIKLAEAVSPSILWIDEIEKAISGVKSSGQTDGGTTNRVLSTFLTWMQEKTSDVFVIATANDHTCIPPEFLRAGRFDEIFFVGLPNEEERKEILKIHIGKKNNAEEFNIDIISPKMEGYSGAEIEKVVEISMLNGFLDKKRKINTQDILDVCDSGKVVPLSKMREEDFENLKEWADTRCRSASSPEVRKAFPRGKGARKLDI